MLITFVSAMSLRRVLRVFSRPRPDEAPSDLPEGVWPLWFVGAAFWFTRRYSLFFLLGLGLDLLFSKVGLFG
jgi:1,4-dihydroxy-2-naphthoate octaprenyltransferase